MSDTGGRRPLDGLKVLDLGQIYNGPYAGFLLAEAGADVVKIEPLEGEALRSRGGGSQVPFAHVMLNVGKRGLAIDLKHERGKALLLDLAREADVLLENFAPGVMERLGLPAERLMRENPRLVYASGTGYGLSGPGRDNLAMDLTVQAVSGVMSINGAADGPPLKTGLAICDFMGGVHLYGGIMTALYERSVTGRGRMVEIAMQEAILPSLATNFAAMYGADGQQPQRRGNAHPAGASAPYNVYRAADGHVAIICVRETHWTTLLDVIGRRDAVADPRFVDQAHRGRNFEAVDAIVEEWTNRHPKEEIARILRERRVPCAPVRELPEVVRDPHLLARQAFVDLDHPELGSITIPTSPLRFHGDPARQARLNPGIGEHGREILASWLGLGDDAIDAFEESGALGRGSA